MENQLDHTHDAAARSWVTSANAPYSDYPIQNLPFGVFRSRGTCESFRGGVAIGDQILDLAALAQTRRLHGLAADALSACAGSSLNPLLALGGPAWHALRHALFDVLHERNGAAAESLVACLVAQDDCEHAVPVHIGDYSDYYTSLHHAMNIGKMFGITTAGSNFEWLPIAYHGRVSSIGVSGQSFRRPLGQIKQAEVASPVVQATRKLDYELELAIYIGKGNELGEPIALADAEQHVFGIGLLNDWSARDIQAWELHPLGPFLAKNFATTVSPWIVTMDALAPFRLPFERVSAPQPLPYLDSPYNRRAGAIDIQLEVWLETAKHRQQGRGATRLSGTNFKHQYWTVSQMVTHHTINGCNLRPGDVLGSGTISGPSSDEAGAMMELARNGTAPLSLPTGEERSFMEDGDAIILRGFCEKPGFARIGFGACRGEVLAAPRVPG
jgi:fumarylacetoacetase